MRIGIDYTPAITLGAGIGRYTRGLVQALSELDRENEYVLFATVRSQVAGRRSQVASRRSQVARNTHHVSRITFHASRFTFYVSRFTFHGGNYATTVQ